MIVLGVICVILGLYAPGLTILVAVGGVLLLIGLILLLAGSTGHPVGGRSHWY